MVETDKFSGNVAREFFAHPKIASQCTGIDVTIIEKLHPILQILTCGVKPNLKKYSEYALRTYELCVEKYPWYPMPLSLHKVLKHGADILETFSLPIGWYSEEAQEANNKTFRKIRLQLNRMTNRTETNKDILKRLLIGSDPYVAIFRARREKTSTVKTEDAKRILKK